LLWQVGEALVWKGGERKGKRMGEAHPYEYSFFNLKT